MNRIRPLRTLAAGVVLFGIGGDVTNAQDTSGEGTPLRLDLWLPGGVWTDNPVVIGADDALNDQFALLPGSESMAAPHNDLTGFTFGRTEPLDDPTFEALTGPDGLLAGGASGPGVYTPPGELMLDEFRSGLQVTFIEAAGAFEAPTTDGNAFVVAVEYADGRYPSPADGNFAGIPKAHRLEIRPEGDVLLYLQYDGTQFSPFQSTTVVVDTCAARPDSGLPCGWVFLTALSGTETEGIEAVGVELYEQQAELGIADRVGEWPGTLTSAAPVLAGTVAVNQQPSVVPSTASPSTSTSTTAAVSAPTEQPEVVAPPPTTQAPVAPPVTESVTVASASGTAAPTVASSDDGSSPALPIALIVGGVAVAAAGLALRQRAKQRQPPAIVAQPDAPASVLQFAELPVATSTRRDDVDIAWSQLLDRNAEAEARVTQAAATVTKTLLPRFVDFATIAGDYTAPYRRAVTGMVMLREHESEMETKLALAKIADLVVTIVNLAMLAKNLGKLAVTGVRWMRRVPGEVASTVVVDPPINAGIGTFTGPQPAKLASKPAWFRPEGKFASNWSEPRLGIDGEDALFWQMDAMAGEVGENLMGVITREGGIEAALEFLRAAVVRKRGFVVFDTADVLRLERIVIQARNAQRGQPHSYRLDDLQWLFARNTPEGREAMRAAISELEIKGSFEATDIPRVLSTNDARLVDGLLDKPGLADAIADTGRTVRVDLGTGAFPAVLDLPKSSTATGTFPAVLDLPTDALRVGNDGFGWTYVPPTVGAGRLLDPVLDSFPGTGVPDTLGPGRFFPSTAGQGGLSDTVAFGDVLIDGARTQPFPGRLFLDPTATVPPGTIAPGVMSLGEANSLAAAVVGGRRAGIVSGAGAPDVIASLPAGTPLSVFPRVPGGAPITFEAPLPADVVIAGTRAVMIFGQGYQTLTDPTLTTLLDVASNGAAHTDASMPVWIGEIRPAEVTYVPTGELPPGTQVVFTDAGIVFVDPSQPMLATPDAPVPVGLAAGGVDLPDPLRSVPLSDLAPDGSWFDPKWIADQQATLGQQAEALAGVRDVSTVLNNMVDPSWMEHDFSLLGVTLDGGATPARLAWITLSAGTSPFEFLTRITYMFSAGGMIGSYVENYASDYRAMRQLVHDAVSTLTAVQDALPATISVLTEARDAVGALADEVRTFGENHPDWVTANQEAFDAKLARDAQTVAHANQSLASLAHLQSLVANLIPWVRALVTAPDGSALPAYLLAWPTSLLRISSTLLMLADAFGRICLLAPAPQGSEPPPVAGERYEQTDKSVPGGVLDHGSDVAPDPEDPDLDAFAESVNEADPVDGDD